MKILQIFAFREKITTIKNRNESRRLVPNYFKIEQGNQWLRQSAQHAIFAYHMVRQTLFIAHRPLLFPGWLQADILR